jgi:hypothetical protein
MSDWSFVFDSLPLDVEPDPLGFILDGLLSEENCEERDYFNIPLGGSAPKPTEWKDEELVEVKLSYDKTEDYTWKIAKSEISTIRKTLSRKLKCPEGILPSFKQIASLFFGPTSKITQIFLSKLEINYETFMLFMATFCLAKELSLPLTHLYKGRIQVDDIMDKESYMNLWTKLAEKQDKGKRYAIPFWKELEDAMNAIFQTCFLIGQNKMIIALDDDKRHYDNNTAQETDGLKQMVHAECRRKGCVAHSAVLPTYGIMVGITWERVGDTSTSCYKRITQSQFGNGHGSNLPPDLNGLLFASGRGYWNLDLFFDYLLKSNADIHGTVKRCPWFPYTYQQVLEKNDTKHYKGELYKVTAQAFQNGTGSVALTMSTVFLNKQFDFISDKTYNKTVNRHTLTLSTFFCIVQVENLPEVIFDVDETFFNALGVTFVTTRQGDPSWFIGRQFSITSSAASDHIKFNLAARKNGKFGGVLPH